MRTLKTTRPLGTAITFHEIGDVFASDDAGLVGATLFDRARSAFAGIHDCQVGRRDGTRRVPAAVRARSRLPGFAHGSPLSELGAIAADVVV